VVKVILYLLLFCFVMFVLLMTGVYYTDKMLKREKVDEEFAKKMDRFRARAGPIHDFFRNLLYWVFGIYIVYLIWFT
jgi:hypothetical protein